MRFIESPYFPLLCRMVDLRFVLRVSMGMCMRRLMAYRVQTHVSGDFAVEGWGVKRPDVI